MSRALRWLLILGALAYAGAAGPVARADEAPIGDTAAAAPIGSLLERVRRDFEGDVLKVELETEDEIEGRTERLVYEVKILTPRGRVLELIYDARNLELLEVEGREDHEGRHDRGGDDDDNDGYED